MAKKETAKESIVLNFTEEKQTKNAVRFQEVVKEGEPTVIGTLYVQKWAVKGRTRLTVTIDDGPAE